MKMYVTYGKRIKHYNHILKATVEAYRSAVDFFIRVCMEEWETLSLLGSSFERQTLVEKMTHGTSKRTRVKYDFDHAQETFYKFPSYLRRRAISEALGKVSSYRKSLARWKGGQNGKMPGMPKAGLIYPCMYRDNMYEKCGRCSAKIKVFIRNTWDWLTIELRKSDVDYIEKYCGSDKECAPMLQRRGKKWYLNFAYEKMASLSQKHPLDQTIAAVDFGRNHVCTCAVMRSDGTIVGRKILKLSKEQDSLRHSVNRIRKARQRGAEKTPRLLGRADGICRDIAVKTARFIIETAKEYDADVIVLGYGRERRGKRKRDSEHETFYWQKTKKAQKIVAEKAHQNGIRIRRICGWNTSEFAYDGSGRAKAEYAAHKERPYPSAVCVFPNGKRYHRGLNTSYNIGARYFIREILKSLPAKERLGIEAEVPQCSRRSTCTWSDLITLQAALAA